MGGLLPRPGQGRAGADRSAFSIYRSLIMEKPAAQGSAATAAQKQERKELAFKDMDGKQKTMFIAKLIVSIVTFGFIFPD
jgi:hypothetical protein